MKRNLRTKSRFHVEYLGGDGAVFFSEAEPVFAYGGLTEEVISSINLSNNLDETRRLLVGRFNRADVEATISFLENGGFLEEARYGENIGATATVLSEMGLDNWPTRDALARTTIDVVNLSSANIGPFSQRMQELGITFSPSPGFIFVFCDDYEDARIKNINEYSLATKTPWLICKPTGVNLWLGPLFTPDYSPCLECLKSRFTISREVENFVRRRKGYDSEIVAPASRTDLFKETAFSVALTQYLRYVHDPKTISLSNCIHVVNPTDLSHSVHLVAKRPQCRTCGDANAGSEENPEIHLDRSILAKLMDGGWRTSTAEDTLSRFWHHISPISGVVKQLTPSMELGPIHVYVAGHNFALKNDSLYFLQDSMRVNSSGKGKTPQQAQASALCEALERYSGLFSGEEKRIRASLSELGSSAIHPNECMLFSERQFAERSVWNEKGARFQVVPKIMENDAQIEWSPVTGFVTGEQKYLPTQYLFYGYPSTESEFFSWADSNGNAAGSTFEDALIQGTFEVIERDAVAIWWYNRIQRPAIDLSKIESSFIRSVDDFLKSVSREFWVLDITTDLSVPSYVAITRRIHGPTEDIVFGFGSHLDAKTAVERSISEMNQFLPPVMSHNQNGETLYQFGDREIIDWWKSATVETESYLLPSGFDAELPSSPPSVLGSGKDTVRLTDVIDDLFDRFTSKGMDVYVLDQTRSDIGLPVAKVIVPGMRHFWARFAPGRLYDVPVELGWQKERTPENFLNPTAMFL